MATSPRGRIPAGSGEASLATSLTSLRSAVPRTAEVVVCQSRDPPHVDGGRGHTSRGVAMPSCSTCGTPIDRAVPVCAKCGTPTTAAQAAEPVSTEASPRLVATFNSRSTWSGRQVVYHEQRLSIDGVFLSAGKLLGYDQHGWLDWARRTCAGGSRRFQSGRAPLNRKRRPQASRHLRQRTSQQGPRRCRRRKTSHQRSRPAWRDRPAVRTAR